MTTTNRANVPHPAGATDVHDWVDLETDMPFRCFDGSWWVVERPERGEDIDVHIAGTQHHDGSITRDIAVHELHADHPLTIKQARELGAALIAAADEAEQRARYDRITVS